MAGATLELVNQNVLELKQEVNEIKEILEESTLEIRDEVIAAVEESRKRPVSEFVSQEEVEKRFS